MSKVRLDFWRRDACSGLAQQSVERKFRVVSVAKGDKRTIPAGNLKPPPNDGELTRAVGAGTGTLVVGTWDVG